MTSTPTEPHARPRAGERLALALLGAWSVVVLEFSWVALGARAEIASVWELQHGALGLAPSWLLLGVAGASLGWLLLTTASVGGRGAEARGPLPRLSGSWAVFTCWALLGGLLGWGVGGGRHLAAPGARLGFSALVALLVAAAAFGGSRWLGRALAWADRGGTRRLVWTAAVAGGVLVLELINQWVLARLYPAFHGALTALALGGAALAWAPWRSALPGTARLRLAVAAVLVLTAGAGLVPGARSVSGFDNLRLILLERGPTLRWGVHLAASVAPPPPAAVALSACTEEPCADPAAASELPEAGKALDWQGRDMFLITVDALRADRLGAYGNERGLTPELDALAREGAVFEAAYAPTPHTSYSVTSLMTGKYMRPLLLQGAGEDSDTWAGLLRTYEYRTAAFYPPAVFFIDTPRFQGFEQRRLDFEYSKVEFAEGEKRLGQIGSYLESQPPGQRLFLWLHLFGPHEPYEAHEGFDFGARDVDRYDAEVAFADRTLGEAVRRLRKRSPDAVILVSADHGEEFGEHGGRYHGTTVYEEQIRVPLLVVAPGSVAPRRIAEPVQTIDLLPTVLQALAVPRPARIRGRDLGPLLAGRGSPAGAVEGDKGLAVAETEDHTLLAEGSFRLICERRIGACQLFDLAEDPGQTRDVSTRHPERFERMRARSRQLAASHGEYETRGLRSEGRGWPAPILRGISGDADAAAELSELLDDADPAIRRKAAELLFELQQAETAGSLRLSLTRDEDPIVRRWAALALTRLGEGAPLVYELVQDGEQPFRRLAALALAETGDARGERELVAWWADPKARDYERSRELLHALAKIRSEDAVGPLLRSLDDVRLRPEIARTLAAIGDKDARGFLVRALLQERYQSARGALVDAIVSLGGKGELVVPLVRFLGVPDPLQGGLAQAQRAGILHHVGGPKAEQLRRVQSLANSGVVAHLNVPPGGNGRGVRLIVLATTRGGQPGRIYLQKGTEPPRENSKDSHLKVRYRPTIEREKALEVLVAPPATSGVTNAPGGAGTPGTPAPGAAAAVEIAVTLPPEWRAKPGHPFALALFADQNVQVQALALVPLADELPPPPPKPWQPK